jgi:xanthine/uracil permease
MFNKTTVLAGIQWLFFIFTNIVVIPLTVGAAFHLGQGDIAAAVQRSFIFTGIACILQATFGHRLPLMEGQTGLWWGVILNLCVTAPAAQISLAELGGSLSVGIIISGILVMLLALMGWGPKIAKLFNPVVMSVFLFLLASQLIIIFFEGMLGLSSATDAPINVSVAMLSVAIAVLAAIISVKGNDTVSRFAILISIIIGWILYQLLFPGQTPTANYQGKLVDFYPWGAPAWNLGIIITAVITGLLNTSNTIAAIKGVEPILEVKASNRQYRSSFMFTGIFSVFSGLFGMVPYSPYVSSLGFLEATRIYQRLPLILGAALFMLMGIITPLGNLFATLPVSIGNAVLFVAYLQLFGSALKNIKHLNFNHKTIYRVAAPTLLGIAIMNLQPQAFLSLPTLIQPLISNGLLVGITLSLVLENC